LRKVRFWRKADLRETPTSVKGQQRTQGDGSILILSNLFRGTSDLNPEA
jgi:hypothetical protein